MVRHSHGYLRSDWIYWIQAQIQRTFSSDAYGKKGHIARPSRRMASSRVSLNII